METSLVTRYKTIKLYGLSEEEVRESIQDLVERHSEIGFLVETYDGRVHIVLSASANMEEEAKMMIKPVSKALKERFGNQIYSTRLEDTLEVMVVRLLEKYELTIATAESCTGGLLSAKLINVPGVSETFREGFVVYSNKAKRKTLNVSKSTLKKYGAVSKQTAKEMAMGAVLEVGTDTGLAITGIAGPDGGTPTKPVGLVYIACCVNDKIQTEEYHFTGTRKQVREEAVSAALNLLRKCILEYFE